MGYSHHKWIFQSRREWPSWDLNYTVLEKCCAKLHRVTTPIKKLIGQILFLTFVLYSDVCSSVYHVREVIAFSIKKVSHSCTSMSPPEKYKRKEKNLSYPRQSLLKFTACSLKTQVCSKEMIILKCKVTTKRSSNYRYSGQDIKSSHFKNLRL